MGLKLKSKKTQMQDNFDPYSNYSEYSIESVSQKDEEEIIDLLYRDRLPRGISQESSSDSFY